MQLKKVLLFLFIVLLLLVLTGCDFKDGDTSANKIDDKVNLKEKKVNEIVSFKDSNKYSHFTDKFTMTIYKQENKELSKKPKLVKEKKVVKDFVTGAINIIIDKKPVVEQAYDEELFTITASTPILEHNNMSITSEWEYNGAGWHNETITSSRELIIKNSHVCINNKSETGSGAGTQTFYKDCIYYPSQYDNETRIDYFLPVSSTTIIHYFKDYYDPTYRNLTVGLVACYDLDDLTDSTGVYDLENVGGTQFVTGLIDDAAQFTNNGSYLNNSPMLYDEFNGDNVITFSVWIKSDVTGQDRSIWSSGSSNRGLQFWMDGDTGGTLRWDLDLIGNSATMESSTGVHTTAWQHWVGVYSTGDSAARPALYKNGVKETPSSITSRTDSLDPKSLFKIGQGVKTGFDGLIDGLMFWNVQLNITDIEDIYNSGSGRSCADLTGGTTDSCTYSSGSHTYLCSDNCVLTSNTDIDTSSTVTITGAGTFTGWQYLTGAEKIRIEDGCRVTT